MEIRELRVEDCESFSSLIVDMYGHINNLEWFTPMPYDYDNVKGMIENPRFYIVGLFNEGELVGVSSLDYKCGKLIGKVDFPSNFDVNNMVEIGFNIVHSSFQGKRAMQVLLDFILLKVRLLGIKYVFSKVHIDNIASRKSLLNKGFSIFSEFSKNVDKEDFKKLSSAEFFSKSAKVKADATLEKFKDNEYIVVDYNILTKEM